MAREKVDNKLNVVIGTKAEIGGDTSIPENSIIVVTDEELKADEIVYSAEKNVKEAIDEKQDKLVAGDNITLSPTVDGNVTITGIGNTYPTAFAWANGTTSGPTGSLTGTSSTVSFGAIPKATDEQSGVVTTGAQTLGGLKTFNDNIALGSGTQTWKIYDDTTLSKLIFELGNTKIQLDGNSGQNKTIAFTDIIPSESTANKILLSTETAGTSKWSDWSSDGFLKTDVFGSVSVDTNTYYTQSQTNTLLNSKAQLDENGIILSSQLPSYVDDVLEYDNLADFPIEGEASKIYIAIDTNLTYRWSGSTYVLISSALALGETSSTAYRGDRGKIAYDHSQVAHAPWNAQPNQTVSPGAGMDFTATTGNVTIAMGTPNEISISTGNSVSGKTHTHKLVLPQDIQTTANPTFAGIELGDGNETWEIYDHATSKKLTFELGNTKIELDGSSEQNKTIAFVEDVQSAITLEPNYAVISDTNGKLTESSVTSTELGYLSGVESSIQDQLETTVKTSGDQTIAGIKTFSSTISGSINGNAATADTATKLGASDVGSTQLPIYLNKGTATAITQANLRKGVFGTTAIGSASQPIYLAANGVPTAITGAIGNNTTGTAANVTGTVAIANGGTGQTSKTNAFNALSPMTSIGDIIYGGAGGEGTPLAGNITTTRKFLLSVGSGTQAGAPSWTTLTKADVGLSNVDNTSDASKPISSATQTALNLKANLASPALTGTPTAPTADIETNTTQIATTAFVKSQGYVTNPGVTSVSAGNGLTFTTITETGSVTLGTPGTLTSTTGNNVTADSHTHAITTYNLTGTDNQITVTGAGKILGAATILSLAQDIHEAASPTFAGVELGSGTTTTWTIDDTTSSGNLSFIKGNKKMVIKDDGVYYNNEKVLTDEWTWKNIIGASETATNNAEATNGSVYLNHLENSTVTSTHKITGAGATTVTSDASGNITISSTDSTTSSNNTISTIYLVGATSQTDNAQTYSNEEVYVTNGTLTTKEVQVGGTAATMKYDATSKSVKFVFA